MVETLGPKKDDLNPKKEVKEQLKLRILIVDDKSYVSNAVKTYLEIVGHEVVVVNDGKELLNKLNSGEGFDVVITDNNMPEMNGIDAFEEVRKNPEFNKILLILHTGLPSSALAARVKNVGGIYLEKPYSMTILDNLFKEYFEYNTQK